LVPLAVQFDRGATEANHEHKWLCPTHHAAIHVLIGQSRSSSEKASKACVNVIGDVSAEGDDRWRRLHELFEVFRNA
jgi:hypothetical protein